MLMVALCLFFLATNVGSQVSMPLRVGIYLAALAALYFSASESIVVELGTGWQPRPVRAVLVGLVVWIATNRFGEQWDRPLAALLLPLAVGFTLLLGAMATIGVWLSAQSSLKIGETLGESGLVLCEVLGLVTVAAVLAREEKNPIGPSVCLGALCALNGAVRAIL